MKFSCDRISLQEAVADSARAAASHAASEILKGVLIEAGDGEVVLTGNNMELAVVARF